MMNKYIFPFLLICFTPFLLMAQDGINPTAKALIVYAEGQGFTVSRADTTEYINIKELDKTVYELQAGDLVNVEAGTVLEIQIYPSRTLIRVAESTTFRLGTVKEDGSGNVEVIYGSVRTQSDENLKKSAITLKGLQTVTAAEGADFELAMVYNPDSTAILNRIYCLEGQIEVVPTAAETPASREQAAEERVVLKAREMLTLKTGDRTGSTGGTGPESPEQIKKEAIPDEVATALQEKNQFKATVFEPGEVELSDAATGTQNDTAAALIAAEEGGDTEPEERMVAGKKFKHFWLGTGVETSFMLINAAPLTSDNPLSDGFVSITDFLSFLLYIRYGVVLDFLVLFNPVVGIGIEAGFLDSSVEVFGAMFHFLNLPVLFVFSLTPGPMYIQLAAGISGIGCLASYTDPFTGESVSDFEMDLYYEAGLKLGLKIDRLIFYLGCAADALSPANFFNGRIDLRFNLGASFRI